MTDHRRNHQPQRRCKDCPRLAGRSSTAERRRKLRERCCDDAHKRELARVFSAPVFRTRQPEPSL